ncbi:MAG: aminotransferase class III-fold pyridoxal phosphate-dependent enzyme [Paracoccaceae bacterium]
MEIKKQVLAVIQARMNSTRLHGKVLKKIGNLTCIEILLERLLKSKLINKIIVATSTNSYDDILYDKLTKIGIDCFRGDENNVYKRFLDSVKNSKASVIVRITGDCPLIDPDLVDKIIKDFLNKNVDYVSNVDPPSFPDGMDIEVINRHCLENNYSNDLNQYHLEHVTTHIRENKKIPKSNYENKEDYSNIRLTLDEEIDLEVINSIVKYFQPNIHFSLEEIIDLYKQNKSLFKNIDLKRNEGSKMNSGQKLWKKAKKLIPGGNMLLSKRTEMFHPLKWPAYFDKAQGCNIWDLDGNKYIDMSLMGVGTNILGYANKDVDNYVKQNIDKSNMSTLNCPEEVFLAEKLVEMHPWSEMVRFARTGGEANSIAVRIGRAASGKDGVAICGYHGWHDWYLASNINDSENLKDHLLPGLEANGVPKELKNTTFPFYYNDLNGLKKVIDENNIGIIKMEVIRNFQPSNNFLQNVRELATKNNIILIFDECTSGFRENFGGIHLNYQVNPDIAIFGKALGNGYAITAAVGTRNVMEAAQKSFISSTFWTERIGVSAALKTLEIMEQNKSWEIITNIGKKIRMIWRDISNVYDLNINISGLLALSSFNFQSKNNLKYKTLITQEMLKNNILASNSVYTSVAHTNECLEKYSDQLNKVFLTIKNCEDEVKNIDTLIEGPICHDGFYRLN